MSSMALRFLPPAQRQEFLQRVTEAARNRLQENAAGFGWVPILTTLAILERDGWRCQACGSLRGLEVHHIQRRSQSGDDSEGNLITLCSDCHRAIHA
jgi:HNH endonuclease